MKASIAIAAALRTQIASGALAQGAPLPVEDELMVELGASRPVVREALRILETEGLVEVRRGLNGGPRVRHPSISDAAKTMGVYLQIGDVPVLDVWTTRDRMIAAAVERLAADHEVVDLAPLEVSVERLAGSIGAFDAFNGLMLDVGEVAVELAGSATEHALVAALRHIVQAEIALAASTVGDDMSKEYARREEESIATAWQRTLRHVRAGQARAARQAFEGQATTLRAMMSTWISG